MRKEKPDPKLSCGSLQCFTLDKKSNRHSTPVPVMDMGKNNDPTLSGCNPSAAAPENKRIKNTEF